MSDFLNLNPYLGYILGVIISSGLLYCAVRVITHGGWFRGSRFIILGCVFCSILLPLLNFEVYSPREVVSREYNYVSPITSDFESAPNLTTEPVAEFATILYMIYFAVTLVFLARIGVSLYKLRKVRFGGNLERSGRFKIAISQSVQSPFSFGRTIYFSPQLDGIEKDMIIRHEEEHLRRFHSIDTTFMQLVCAIFWINPFFYLLKRNLQEVHEFEADNAVLRCGFDTTLYKNLIFDQINYNNPEIANSLVFSLTKKRIIMLTTKHKTSWFRLLVLVPAIIFSMAIVSASPVQSAPDTLKIRQTQTDEKLPNKNNLIYVLNGVEMTAKQFSATNPHDFATIKVLKGDSAIAIYGDRGKNGAIVCTTVQKEDPVVFSDQPALFEGKPGAKAFSEWCQANIKYPANAAKNKVSGKVTASFVVETDGSISNIKIVRSIDPALDKAVLDVISRGPKSWTPAENKGKKVRLLIQIPIYFKL